MRVLFITRKYPPSVGGMQLFARDLAESLAKITQLDVVKWGGSNKWLPLVLPLLFLQSGRVLITKKPDIIHAQDGLLAPMGYFLAKLFRKPYVVVIHGLDITHKNLVYQKLVVPFVAKADKVICISAAAKRECINRGVSEAKIVVITLAVQDNIYPKLTSAELPNNINLSADVPVLLTVGRLVKRKGVSWFIANVLPSLTHKYPTLQYLVAGEGQEMSAIEESISSNKLESNVILLGRTSDAALTACYSRANIFVMPNINIEGDIEGFGLVSLEAALCELPVVAAKTEGIVDAIIDQKNGILVEAGDAAEFIRVLTKLIDHPENAREFGKNSRNYTLEQYQWDEIAQQYSEQYLQLTEQNT